MEDYALIQFACLKQSARANYLGQDMAEYISFMFISFQI